MFCHDVCGMLFDNFRVNQQLGEKSHHQDMLLTAHNAVQPDEHHPQTVFDDNGNQ